MSEIDDRKDLAENLLDSAILEIAECIKFGISDEAIKSIRVEVIKEGG